ncbi:MAG: N-acetylglucosamine-6-phosphate deacetylase [Armatimonadota bacterium]|nr:N-acetylglucosamine-6-phosphate deacetylase [Armatimonadota bacterium]MDR5675731.1 N-acetylglucosamine-6-phosphate deacetylase [Armatimonadota bacterium]MDR5688563.1 N-acetylglucosamine-6-phosphate deacetylase [Armatimonadota bacterium]MDR7388998.1 N-acetylglucosamine-6-phosphate deacetylase [Armatimonadota bacterium]MDR7390624.1 N-acetylglucosamine-6-phosphate deacetylase [Armatimonadota bacterium]
MISRLVLAAGVVVAPDRDLVPGYVVVEDGLIAEVREGTPRRADREFPHGVLVPGFVDLQVNGAAGADFLSCTPEQFAAARRYLASTGTTSFLPTLITAPPEVVRAAAQVVAVGAGGGAQPVGLHLEGPAISPKRAGAHDPRWIVPPGDPSVRRLVADLGGLVRAVTVAPEQPGGLELVRWLAGAGVVASVGHSDATYQQAREAFEAGAGMVTHLFNAMRGLHHREPGVVGAALEDGAWVCGLVADGVHVHPAAFRLAYRLLGSERMALVTDAMAAAGAAPGRYRLGGALATVLPGEAPRLADGTLAGTVLRMDEAVDNATRWGVPLRDAVRMATTTPARVLRLEDRGLLRPGLRADLCVLVEGRAALTVVAGEVVWDSF